MCAKGFLRSACKTHLHTITHSLTHRPTYTIHTHFLLMHLQEIEELHAEKDRRHPMRKLFTRLVHECCPAAAARAIAAEAQARARPPNALSAAYGHTLLPAV